MAFKLEQSESSDLPKSVSCSRTLDLMHSETGTVVCLDESICIKFS